MVKQFTVPFPIFKRELFTRVCVKVIVFQGIAELNSPKSFRSQLDLCKVIIFLAVSSKSKYIMTKLFNLLVFLFQKAVPYEEANSLFS